MISELKRDGSKITMMLSLGMFDGTTLSETRAIITCESGWEACFVVDALRKEVQAEEASRKRDLNAALQDAAWQAERKKEAWADIARLEHSCRALRACLRKVKEGGK